MANQPTYDELHNFYRATGGNTSATQLENNPAAQRAYAMAIEAQARRQLADEAARARIMDARKQQWLTGERTAADGFATATERDWVEKNPQLLGSQRPTSTTSPSGITRTVLPDGKIVLTDREGQVVGTNLPVTGGVAPYAGETMEQARAAINRGEGTFADSVRIRQAMQEAANQELMNRVPAAQPPQEVLSDLPPNSPLSAYRAPERTDIPREVIDAALASLPPSSTPTAPPTPIFAPSDDLKSLFRKYMGSSYDPNSREDRSKMQYLQGLSTKGVPMTAANIYDERQGYGKFPEDPTRLRVAAPAAAPPTAPPTMDTTQEETAFENWMKAIEEGEKGRGKRRKTVSAPTQEAPASTTPPSTSSETPKEALELARQKFFSADKISESPEANPEQLKALQHLRSLSNAQWRLANLYPGNDLDYLKTLFPEVDPSRYRTTNDLLDAYRMLVNVYLPPDKYTWSTKFPYGPVKKTTSVQK
jgi:hypothetical protein